MKKLLSLAQMLFTLTIPGCGQNAFDRQLKLLYKQTVPLIQPDQLTSLYQQKTPFILLDTRSPAEYEVSHLPQARFVNYKPFTLSELEDINPNMPVILYCSVGVRSEKIGEKLQEAGFKNIRNLYGGIFTWKNQGHPVVDRYNQPTEKVHAYNRVWGIWLKKGIKVYE
ncbi:rhodanese-like domain-containing protein [Adhaeribacter swui]|uniref:Rhodanese-like domain-containing protein n=1 Tax=Adhaeribacter swui TaxID=2086471 RepID=A0A7G7GDA5_9BACT|nr:rhodanese-like domain-containing protein [Adhaeribacter swui]QNF35139.1 rhodanese-like domain-containing protein [Adhaeribacter swui]